MLSDGRHDLHLACPPFQIVPDDHRHFGEKEGDLPELDEHLRHGGKTLCFNEPVSKFFKGEFDRRSAVGPVEPRIGPDPLDMEQNPVNKITDIT